MGKIIINNNDNYDILNRINNIENYIQLENVVILTTINRFPETGETIQLSENYTNFDRIIISFANASSGAKKFYTLYPKLGYQYILQYPYQKFMGTYGSFSGNTMNVNNYGYDSPVYIFHVYGY